MSSLIPAPDYVANFPSISGRDYLTDTQFSMGWITWIHFLSNGVIKAFFSHHEYHFNEGDLLDFDEVKVFQGPHPIVYLCTWILMTLIITVSGLVWCIRTRKRFCGSPDGGGGGDKQEGFGTSPPTKMRIVTGLLTICILGMGFMLIVLFDANQRLKSGLNKVPLDMTRSVSDVREYLAGTQEQLHYTFSSSFESLNFTVLKVLAECPSGCEELSLRTISALEESRDKLQGDLRTLSDPLDDLLGAATDVDDEVDVVKEIASDMKDPVYGVFMLFNLIYLVIIGFLTFGTVHALRKFKRDKPKGNAILRWTILLLIFVRLCLVVQILLVNYSVGMVSQVMCPAFRKLEDEPSQSAAHLGSSFQARGYNVPSFVKIMRECKADKPAYQALDLEQVFHLSSIDEINDKFNSLPPGPGGGTVEAIQGQVKSYTEFAKSAVGLETGKCSPVYGGIDGMITVICRKVAEPLVVFWGIMQVMELVMLVTTVSAMILEQY